MNQRIAIMFLTSIALLALSSQTIAGDLSDWGKKINADRFVVLTDFNSEAVLDKETQLVWQTAPAGKAHDWSAARSICRHAITGERAAWRLPSVHELASLYDMNKGLNVAPIDLTQDIYWSATSVADDVNSNDTSYEHAYMVIRHPSIAFITNVWEKAWEAGVLCVRGPSSAVIY